MAILQSAVFNYAHITTNTTALLFTPQANNQSSQAVLHSITVNSKGATSNTITVYNDVTAVAANAVAIIDSTVGQPAFLYDVKCPNGLTIVTASGTAPDITVTWRVSSQE